VGRFAWAIRALGTSGSAAALKVECIVRIMRQVADLIVTPCAIESNSVVTPIVRKWKSSKR
jgi:hypothetical protein